MSTELPETGTD